MADDLVIPPGASEAEVADTIVSARKSWKTVKGKSEPVWPPVLEKALVKALLQYKPTDSRYARALGRFPKRNRFISDYIFEHTGQRRTPKQVGSRLQQLKDVNCGKQLLSHVASWSLGPGPTPSAPTGMDGLDFSSPPHISINSMSGIPSDCTPSPSSPFPHMRTPFTNDHSALSPLATSFYSPTSQYSSLPVTPQVRRLDVFLPYDPAALQSHSSVRGGTLMRFSGCLARPESVQSENEASSSSSSSSHSSSSHSPPPSAGGRAHSRGAQGQPAVLDREPKVTFTAREPIAASSVVSVWVEGGPADDGSGANIRTAHLETFPLVCIGTPSLAPYGGGGGEDDEEDEDGNFQQRSTRMAPPRSHQPQQAVRQVEYFSYSTQLVSNVFWETMRRDSNLSKYTITQDLIYQLDTPTARTGDSFLQIAYHFVPTATPSSSSSPLAHANQIRAVRARGSASPASSSGSSSSASPASVFQMPLQPHSHHHHQQQQQQQYLQQQMGMYATATSQAAHLGMAGLSAHHSMQMHQPPMLGLASSSCSSVSSSSGASIAGMQQQQSMSRHGSPHDHLYAMHPQQPSPPGGSPLSAGFPPLSTRSGMTPNLGFDDEFVGAALGVGVVGDFAFNTSSAHGSPLALA